MTLAIDALEAIWIVLNLTTFLLTLSALVDARADQAAVLLLNGKARELAARGIARRELFRLVIQGLLLGVVIPGVFVDRPTPLSPVVAILMAVPAVLLVSSLLDARDRRAMTILVTAEVLLDHTTALDRIETKIDMNTEISQGARDDAHVAAEVANNVNEKIANLDAALVAQGAVQAHEIEESAVAKSDIADTHKMVSDLHDGSAPGKAG